MKIAVLSGKGGTGKTFVSTNLAAAAKTSTYIDCDVEEPDGRLFLNPENVKKEQVLKTLPSFNEDKCNGCRKCIDFCKFNALVFLKNIPMVFSEVCHSCGGCSLVCDCNAITEKSISVGNIEQGKFNNINVITGILNLGKASAVPVIKSALKKGLNNKGTIIIDCPPGSSCSVMESIKLSDCCILVAEPTSFGLYNLKMVYKLVKLFNKKCFIVINKYDSDYKPLEDFCFENNIKILLKIPYSSKLATLISEGKLAYNEDKETSYLFDELLKSVIKEVAQ